jgi:hypothetical protein
MSQIWSSPIPAPSPGPPQPAADIAGTKTDDLKLSIGLSLLSNILNGLGSVVGLPKLTLAYQRARSLQYTFGEVVAISIDPFAIGAYLSKGDLQQDNPFVDHYFDQEETTAYILTEVLKSDSVTVTAKSDQGTSVSVDLPAIQQLVGVNVSVTSNSSDNSELTYKGKAMLTFGFKAFAIMHADNKWSVEGVAPSGNMAFFEGGEEQAAGLKPIMLSTGCLLRLGHERRPGLASAA